MRKVDTTNAKLYQMFVRYPNGGGVYPCLFAGSKGELTRIMAEMKEKYPSKHYYVMRLY